MARPPILTLSDISLTFGGNPVFDGLGLTIQEGDRMCLVGRNGSGKSTLMKVIAGLIEADQGNIFLRPGQTVGYMDQHPDLSAFATLGDYARSELDPMDAYKVDIIADGLKLNLDTSPKTASGGERRRSALVKIMAEEPELMLLDEPTNHLDIEAIQWLEDELRQTKKAFVLISHDRAFLRTLTRATMWVDRGKVRQNPQGFEAFEDWRDKTFEEEDQQRHKLNRLIKAEARWAVEGISARRKRNQGRVRRLGDLKDERSSQIKRQGAAAMAFADGPKSGKLVVNVDGVSKAFESKTIVDNLTLKVTRGERIALVGPNGVGKTTVLNILTGALEPDSGTVKMGVNLLPAIFDQNRSALNPAHTLWESLTEDKDLGVSGKNDQIMVRGMPRHVVGYLKEFLFDENQARGPVSVLSGGEKARLLLSRIMARESNLLVMDEPTNDLDVETLDLLQEILDGYDGTVLLVSHDRDFLDRVATTTLAFEGNGVVTPYAGGWTDYQTQKKLRGGGDVVAKKAGKKKQGKTDKSATTAVSGGITFAQSDRLEKLPAMIERTEAEITKLEEFLSQPDLFTEHPVKFQKATDGLIERHEILAKLEEEWVELEALNEANS
jgi:ATP-binding cassette subfamily F protein uup